VEIINASIVTAFDAKAIGTKVTEPIMFRGLLREAVGNFQFPTETVEDKGIVEGQGFIRLDSALPHVSAGVGLRTLNPDDFVLREYRGEVQPFLKREHAIKADGFAAVVYTREAYLVDPDVVADPAELARVKASDATHVFVCAIAFAGPKAPLSPRAFVHNLAGGNTNAQGLSGDVIREQAAEIDAYHAKYATVAD